MYTKAAYGQKAQQQKITPPSAASFKAAAAVVDRLINQSAKQLTTTAIQLQQTNFLKAPPHPWRPGSGFLGMGRGKIVTLLLRISACPN